LKNELEIEENEVQSLMHQMNVDTRIEVADMIDEGDIIAAVQEAPEEEDGGRGKRKRIHNNIKYSTLFNIKYYEIR